MPTPRIVTIGADPEFAFSKDGTPVRADSLLRGGTSAKFGTDGAPNTAELRPDPADTASGLVENIRKVTAEEVRRNPELLGYDWNAEPSFNRQPLGGHIHFGFAPNPEFTRILDVLLAYPYAALERSSRARGRKRDYGRLSDTRQQPWGMEYRSLSTWLVSEERALAVLTTAHALATLWVQDRAALLGLYEQAGGELSEVEKVAYLKHSKSRMRARVLKSRAALKAFRHPALSLEHLTWIKNFCVEVRIGIDGGLNKFGDTKMNWTIDGVKMKAQSQEREAASREAIRAERAASSLRRRVLSSLRLSTVTEAWSSPLVEQGIPVEALGYCESDDRLGEICQPMTRRVGSSWTVPANGTMMWVYGLRGDRPDQVWVTIPTASPSNQRVLDVVAWLRQQMPAVTFQVVEAGVIPGAFEVGLRRDLRNELGECRKIVTILALAARGIAEVA